MMVLDKENVPSLANQNQNVKAANQQNKRKPNLKGLREITEEEQLVQTYNENKNDDLIDTLKNENTKENPAKRKSAKV